MAKKEVQAKKPVPGAWLLKQLLLAFVIVVLLVVALAYIANTLNIVALAVKKDTTKDK